jgi:hypothetical protein
MIWLTWRQFRTQAVVAAAALVVLAVVLVVTGMNIAHLYNTSGIPGCHAHGNCQQVAASYINQLRANRLDFFLYDACIVLVYLAPAAMGAFWGAPLIAREFEAGTHRLAWNQSVSRTRWLTVKIGLIGLASMATAGLLSLMSTWWFSPVNRAAAFANPNGPNAPDIPIPSRLAPLLFGARGITPIGYALFAFALGVAFGVLIRRTVPAMAATIGAFAAVQVIMPNFIRPHLIAPVHSTLALTVANIDQIQQNLSPGGATTAFVGTQVNLPGAWVLSNADVSAAGRPWSGPMTAACNSQSGPQQACPNSLAALHLKEVVTYQPASAYWPLQWYETAIFVVVALALIGFSVWWVRRRRVA